MSRTRFAGAVLMITLALSVSCSSLGRRSDDAIATDIKAQMFSDPSLKSANVDVAMKDGVVTLTGQVPDDTARLAAYKIATATKGVTKVNDQMSVVSAQTAPAAVEPAPAAAAEPARPASKSRSTRPRHAASSSEGTVASAAVPNDQPAPISPAAPAA